MRVDILRNVRYVLTNIFILFICKTFDELIAPVGDTNKFCFKYLRKNNCGYINILL